MGARNVHEERHHGPSQPLSHRPAPPLTNTPLSQITTNSTIFASDGRLQVQNACNADPSALYYFTDVGLYQSWAISEWRGNRMLRLGAFDGSLLPRMYQVSEDPTDYMWPTRALANATGSG